MSNVTIKEAAEILGVGDQTVRLYVKEEKLTSTKEGKLIMIPRSEVEAMKEEREKEGKKPRKRRAEKTMETTSTTEPQNTAPTPIPTPMETPTEVPVKSIVALTTRGSVWKMNLPEKKWEQVGDASGMTVTVIERQNNGAQTFLVCGVPGSQSQWCILESDVLSENHNLVSRPITVPQMPPAAPPTQPEPVEATPSEETLDQETEPETSPVSSQEETGEEDSDSESAENPEPEEDRSEEMERKISYSNAIISYGSANNDKLKAAAEFKKVDKENRPVIWDYLMDYGEESETGKNDRVVEDFGYKAILTFTPGRPVVKRDEVKVVTWLLENGHTEALTYSVNPSVWDELKKSGVVPPEFVASVETVEKTKDTRKLIVNKIRTDSEE